MKAPSPTNALGGTTRARRYHILVLPTEYPESARPEVVQGVWAREQARALSREHKVTVLYPTADPASRSGVSQDGEVQTRIVAYRHLRKSWLLSGLVVTWRALLALGSRPDCIHAHGLYPAGINALIIGRALGIPVVVTEHWGQLGLRTRGHRRMKHLLAFVLRNATATVAVSKHLAAEMVALEPRCRPAIVANTVHPLFFESSLRPPRSEARIHLLFVGRLAPCKGLDHLLGALGRVAASDRPPFFRLTVVGDGAEMPRLEKLAATLPPDAVEFRGALPLEAIVAEMAGCDVFVMPSTYETFGLVFAEAMAAGTPVIACTGTAAEEIVPTFAGVLVPRSDTGALADALRDMCRGYREYDRAAIREYARQRFSHEAFLEAMSTVYDRAMARMRRVPEGPAS